MEFLSPYLTAFVIGLFGGVHCLGMCGGIAAALSFAVRGESRFYRGLLVVFYNLGRITSYGLLGGLLGWLVSLPGGEHAGHGVNPARLVAGALLIVMGLYLADWWRGLLWLERGGAFFWRYLQPLSRRLFPVHNPAKAWLLGMLWGWLPCGLVYSALAYSAARGGALDSALTMVAFGAGTLPALLASGMAAEHLRGWVQRRGSRQIIGLCIMAFGVWTLWGGLGGHGVAV